MKKSLLLSLTLVLIFAFQPRLWAQDVLIVEGNIYDAKTGEGVPFVTIQVEGTGFGGVSNADGHFKLRLDDDMRSRSLLFFCVGYERAQLAINDIKNPLNLKVQLQSSELKLEEVVVDAKGLDPRNLLREAIEKIPTNYPNQPFNMEGFYRELIRENDRYVKLSEAVCQFYYIGYDQKLNLKEAYESYHDYSSINAATFISGRWYDDLTFPQDQVKVLQARVSENLFRGEINTSIAGGPLGLMAFDKVKYPTYFMSSSNNKVPAAAYRNYLRDYEYKLENVTKYDQNNVYVLSFAPKKVKERVNLKGKIYIDIESLAFVAFEYEMLPSERPVDYVLARNLLRHTQHKVRLDYRQYDGKWYPHQLSVDDIVTVLDRRTQKEVSTYETASEILISDIKTENVQSFNEKDIFKNTISNHLYEYPLEYKPDFWDKYYSTGNFIPLENNVRQDLEQNMSLEKQFLAKQTQEENQTAPRAKQIPRTVARHGIERQDPYSWLRNRNDKEVINYLRAENKYADNELLHLRPSQREWYNKMISRVAQAYKTPEAVIGNYEYYQRYEAGRLYPKLCRRSQSGDSPEEVLLDVNELAKGKEFFELADYQLSPDGKTLAFMVDTTGNFHTTVHFLDIEQKRFRAERLNRVTSMAWSKDSQYLFYAIQDETNRSHEIYRHQLGKPQYDDKAVHREKDLGFSLMLSKSISGDYIFINSRSQTTSEVHYFAASDAQAKPTLFRAREKGHFYQVEASPDAFYVLSNEKAPNGKVLKLPLASTNWKSAKVILKEDKKAYIEDFVVLKGYLATNEIQEGQMQVRVLNLSDQETHFVPLSKEFFTSDLSNHQDYNSGKLRIGYRSFVQPQTAYEYDLASKNLKQLGDQDLVKDLAAENYNFTRIEVGSEKVPVTLVSRKGVDLKANNPLMLTGWGMLGKSDLPVFDPSILALVDEGFVYAVAHVRGGREKGSKWYEEGRLLKKKNSFEDFISVADYLCKNQYTSPQNLVAYGHEEGALLIGYAVNERPELFRVAIFDNALLDMVNVIEDPKLPLTNAQKEEWGDAANKEEYAYVASYSPYERVKAQNYPKMLFFDYLYDEEIPFWSSAKMVAKLRATKTDDNTLVLRTNMSDGHSGPSGRYQEQRQYALIMAYLLEEFKK